MDKKNPKVTIIMPSLNVRAYIQESLESATQQSLDEIEILCVDAGSEDGTLEIIKGFEKKDQRIRYIHSDKRSYGHQLNLALNNATGKYIGILETDDYADEHMYEVLYRAAEREQCDFVKADYAAFVVEDDGSKFFVPRKTFPEDKYYHTVLCPKKLTTVALGDWYNCQGIYRRQFILDHNLSFSETPGAAFQDIGFLYQSIIKAERVMYLKDSLYRYRIDREESSSNSGNGFRYSYQEFYRLVNMPQYEEWDFDDRRVLYCRMVKSAIGSLIHMLKKQGRMDDQYIDCDRWFREQFQYSLGQGYITREGVGDRYWEQLQAYIESVDTLKKQLKEKKNRIKETIGTADSWSVAVFGCGNFGYDAYRDLNQLGYSIVAYMDNNSNLWGKTCYGIRILDPSHVGELGDNVRVVIANERYAAEIREQLVNLGVANPRIVEYSP